MSWYQNYILHFVMIPARERTTYSGLKIDAIPGVLIWVMVCEMER